MSTVPEASLRMIDAEVARRVMGLQHVEMYRRVRVKYRNWPTVMGAVEDWRAKWQDDHPHQWHADEIVEELGDAELRFWGAGESRPVPHYSSEPDHVLDVFGHLRRHGVYVTVEPEHGPGANYRMRSWRAYTGARLAEATGPDVAFLACSVALVAAGILGVEYAHGDDCRYR